jgi:hypothetical protein
MSIPPQSDVAFPETENGKRRVRTAGDLSSRRSLARTALDTKLPGMRPTIEAEFASNIALTCATASPCSSSCH